jgi:hypothetical protein
MRIDRFFSQAGLEVLIGEIIWIWMPMAFAYFLINVGRKKMHKKYD